MVKFSKQVREICFQLDENVDRATEKVLEAEKARLVKLIESEISKVYKMEF